MAEAVATARTERGRGVVGIWVLAVVSLLGLIDAIYDYVAPNNGIHGTEGALLVVVSTALMLIAAALIAFGVLRGGWRVLFEVLIFLDILGTGTAAYFLEAYILVGLMVVALIAWLVQIGAPAAPARLRTVEVAR
jgi:hypothetical protein